MMQFFYSLTGGNYVGLELMTIPKRGDLDFMRLCVTRAMDQVEEKVMERVVIKQMIVTNPERGTNQ